MKNKLLETSQQSIDGFKREDINLSARVTLSKIEIEPEIEKKIGYENGSYRLFNFDYNQLYKDYNLIIKEIKNSLNELVSNPKKVLVVGLGNEGIVCDSLGARTVNKLLLLSENNEFKTHTIINGLIPNVLGVTGIESFDIIMGVTKQINPDLIICIDTLSANRYESLFKSIQISNTTITPGSGVKNARKKLSKDSLGKPIIVFGIPMLISLSNLVNSFVDTNIKIKNEEVWLSPKDVDFAVEEFSYIISKSINEYFYPEIKANQIEKMVKGIF